jgi:septal ring factor EnvC (AmiA/AmiB activator)
VAEKIEFATQTKLQQQQAVKTRKKVYEDACRELEKRRSSVQALLRVTQNDITEIDQTLSETRTTLADVEVKRQAWQERISGLEEENFKRYGVRAVGAKIDRLIEQQVLFSFQFQLC